MEHVHLHVHSDASLKDGLGQVKRLVTGASTIGAPALALTDHGTLANAVSFTIACEAAGIKPIMGLEGYIAFDGKIGHITLLADGDEGWKSLVAINNAGHASNYRHPAFRVDTLVENSKGILCLTGCVASPFHQMSLNDSIRLGARLKSAFGSRLFAEIMCVADTDTWTRPLELASALGIKTVLTNDAHFPYREDAPLHPVLTTMKAGYKYNSTQLWLKSPTEMFDRASMFIPADVAEDAMQRTVKIAQKIRSVTLKRKEQLPDIEDADGKLRSMVVSALAMYDHTDYVAAHERAMYELEVIAKMGFSSYFLILYDIVNGARTLGTLVGPGRGSGVGSFVLHLLGITKPDPLEFDLPFERFLNPQRSGMPDVDVDLDSVSRHNVIDYAAKKWGAHPVMTYARYSHKTLLHDLAVQYGVPRELEQPAGDAGPESNEFGEICNEFPELARAYDAFNGQIRNKGKHAGGIIITDAVVPIERATNKGERAVAWTEGVSKELSYAGVVKFDLLGLAALTALKTLQTRFGFSAPRPEDGSPVFEIFQKGDLAGVFQFAGSPGIVQYTKEMHPEKFEDLVAINALYRPGALDVGSAQKYPQWKVNPRKVHPLFADILAPTYGAVVYQEQVMGIFARVLGGTLADGDSARRVIFKALHGNPEWEAKLAKMQKEFVAGAVGKGLKLEEAEQMWTELAAHSRYSFNKAHAVAYAWVAWETAWWKYYHRAAFYAAMLNIDAMNAATYTFEAITHGIEFKPPHVNISGHEYTSEGDAIFMPLSSIKYLGAGAEAIEKARSEGGPFKSYADFMMRVPKKIVRANAREGLLVMGGFEGLSGTLKDLQVKLAVLPERDKESYMKYIGFVLPTAETIKRIRRAKKKGLTAGIVSQIIKKKSKFGDYRVYRTAPAGSFWSRDIDDIAVGDYVEVKVKKNSGKLLEVIAHE